MHLNLVMLAIAIPLVLALTALAVTWPALFLKAVPPLVARVAIVSILVGWLGLMISGFLGWHGLPDDPPSEAAPHYAVINHGHVTFLSAAHYASLYYLSKGSLLTFGIAFYLLALRKGAINRLKKQGKPPPTTPPLAT